MINPLDMTGRRVMVTGASSGLGRATSILLSQLGAKLVLVARNRDRLEATLRQLSGASHHVVERDLAEDQESVPKWMKQVCELTGPLHGLVHSAGVYSVLPLRALTLDKLNAVMRMNFSSTVMLAKGFRQRGVVAAPASLVFLGSISGLSGQPALSAYSASKGAIFSLTRSLALELAPEQIRVNALAPGMVVTEMTDQFRNELPPENFAALERGHPLGLGKPEDVANAVAFLLADTGRWITGTTLVVDGGYTCQ